MDSVQLDSVGFCKSSILVRGQLCWMLAVPGKGSDEVRTSSWSSFQTLMTRFVLTRTLSSSSKEGLVLPQDPASCRPEAHLLHSAPAASGCSSVTSNPSRGFRLKMRKGSGKPSYLTLFLEGGYSGLCPDLRMCVHT